MLANYYQEKRILIYSCSEKSVRTKICYIRLYLGFTGEKYSMNINHTCTLMWHLCVEMGFKLYHIQNVSNAETFFENSCPTDCEAL